MSTNRLATGLFGATLAGALLMIIASRLAGGGPTPPERKAKATGSAATASEARGVRDGGIASPFAALPDGVEAEDGDAPEATPPRPARPARPSVYQGPTWFDDDEEKLVTRLSSDRPEEVRFAPRDVDHVERRDDGETVLVLRRGTSILVTDELLEAAPEALRERIAYEGPPPGETSAE